LLLRLWCYIVWSATTAGLLLLEPMNVLLFGAGTVPTKPFQNVSPPHRKSVVVPVPVAGERASEDDFLWSWWV
jgi:hypothetical protein